MHETIQPIIQKETIQPSIIHTTIPIHEIHHHEAKHHAASALPAVSMSEFRAQGGSLRGREERVDGFEGEPKPVASTLGGGSVPTGLSSTHGNTGVSGAGPHNSKLENKLGPRVDSDLDGSRNMGASRGSTGTTTTHGNTGVSGTGPHDSKILNKLDPRVDSNNDGSVGVGK